MVPILDFVKNLLLSIVVWRSDIRALALGLAPVSDGFRSLPAPIISGRVAGSGSNQLRAVTYHWIAKNFWSFALSIVNADCPSSTEAATSPAGISKTTTPVAVAPGCI